MRGSRRRCQVVAIRSLQPEEQVRACQHHHAPRRLGAITFVL